MRKKDKCALDKILECAKNEFMEKGFDNASMRSIAEKANYTTGMLYSRYSDKEHLFQAVVDGAAEKLFNYFKASQEEFAAMSPEQQRDIMSTYSSGIIDNMIEIIFADYDIFKLIVCKSKGSTYEDYIDKLVDIETLNTIRFINLMKSIGEPISDVRTDLNHILASALFNGLFEIVRHDYEKEDAKVYVKQICKFYTAGWCALVGYQLDY